jgi:hypothetical protein
MTKNYANTTEVQKSKKSSTPLGIFSIYSFASDLIASGDLSAEEAMEKSFSLLTRYQDKLNEYYNQKASE